MKKLRITWLYLILAGILLGVSSCSNDAEELQGKLVITFAKPTKGLKVAICSMENTKYPILVESPNVNGVLKVSLNIGNYYINPLMILLICIRTSEYRLDRIKQQQ